jgi:hypothetical protein
MQGQLIEQTRVRKSMWDGAFGLGYALVNTTVNFNFPANGPYAIAISNGTTPLNVTMYDPTVPANQMAPGVMWCHELINLGTGAGAITVKGKGGGTIGTLNAGKRAELIWVPVQTVNEWVCFLSA